MKINKVAPHAGAWVETNLGSSKSIMGQQVAPHAGAWVETTCMVNFTYVNLSLPMRERGLKLLIERKCKEMNSRSPCGSVG